jgi:hypothetical protein
VAPSSAKIGFFSETFSQCFFNEQVGYYTLIQQVVHKTLKHNLTNFASLFISKSGRRLQPFTEDTLGGGNLRGPNIPVP